MQSKNFTCRIITDIKKFDHVTPGMQELKWFSIENLLMYKDMVVMYEFVNNLAQDYLANKFIKRSDIHNRQTRNIDLLETPSYIEQLPDKEHFTTMQ